MPRPMPTTKAQVSGHKFLQRRVEHGLILGDIRMIHDPLASRRRALIFGSIAVAFLAIGSGMLAWLQPNPNPGDAPIVRSQEGQLFVLVNDSYHPVSNLASARLIAGEPAAPQAMGNEFLSNARLGTPLGIADAPDYLADPATPTQGWAACYAAAADEDKENPTTIDEEGSRPGETVVLANAKVEHLRSEEAALVSTGGKEWLLTSAGRVELPSAASTQGRVLRRGIGVRDDSYVWQIPEELLNAYAELPPLRFPEQTPQILDTGDDLWVRVGAGDEQGVASITPTQAEMLAGMGASHESVDGAEVAALSDAALPFNLPANSYDFLSPGRGWLCADERGATVLSPAVEATVSIAGKATADRFAGLEAGGVGVDSGHGFHVVSATGIRHSVAQGALVEALGTTTQAKVPWEILRLLPEGSPLDRESALASQGGDEGTE